MEATSREIARATRTGSRNNAQRFDPPRQYTGGMNLYQYVGSDPSNATDPWALDRYKGNNGFHQWVAVDRWRCLGGRFQKTGKVSRFDFSVDWDGWWPLGAVLYPGRVTITELNGNPGGTRKASSPCADIAMRRWLILQWMEPPYYSALLYNCRSFVAQAWGKGGWCPKTMRCPDCCQKGKYRYLCTDRVP